MRPLNIATKEDGSLSYSNEITYDGIVDSFEYEVLTREDIGSYQGDILYMLYDNKSDRFGFLAIGYGSCSGCDALEAAESKEEIETLQQSLYDSIKWHDLRGAIKFFADKDNSPFKEWYYSEENAAEFLTRCKDILEQERKSRTGLDSSKDSIESIDEPEID